MKSSEIFRKYPHTTDFDYQNYRFFERVPAVPGTSNNRGLTVHKKLNYGVFLLKVVTLFMPNASKATRIKSLRTLVDIARLVNLISKDVNLVF